MLRALALTTALLVLAAPAAADATERDERWEMLHQASKPALVAASRDFADGGQEAEPARPDADAPQLLGQSPSDMPLVLVVGFTGGVERHDSSVSGVVRLREAVSEHIGHEPDVSAFTYNNFRWRRAATDVLALAAQAREAAAAADGTPQTPGSPLAQPLIVVYGHSWGGGAISKFARVLRDEGLEISLAVFIDAFTVRNPRVPDNVRYAVNFYQRSGLLRGLPLRGKRQLIPESPESTVILGSYRISPDTDRFGWSWNLIQPLLYRHHHRISHDVRLQRYLVEITGAMLELAAGPEPELPVRVPAAEPVAARILAP